LVRNPNFVGGDHNDGWGWLRYGRWTHLGDVYIDGQGLTEQETDAGLSKPLTWRAEVEVRDDHAGYIANWLDALKNDNRCVVQAASYAQKAVDYLHGLQPQCTAVSLTQTASAATY